jgi:hypothetical protein
MRRTLAITLAAGVLLLGGCGKQQPPAAAPPAATSSAGPSSAGSTPGASPAGASPAAASPAAASTADGVDDLLDQVDQQINGDDQPAADQD